MYARASTLGEPCVCTPRACAWGKAIVCRRLYVTVSTKTAWSGVLGTWVSCNGDETIKNCKKNWLEIERHWPREIAIPRVDSAAHALTQYR